MNREDIIRMAHESHLDVYGLGTDYAKFADALGRFYNIAVSAERERIKQANAPEIERINAHIKELEDAIKAARETCEAHPTWTGRMCGEAIKARGQA